MKNINIKDAEEVIINGEKRYIYENRLYNSNGEYLHGIEGTDGDITDTEWETILNGD